MSPKKKGKSAMDAKILNKMKHSLDRVSEAFCSTINYTYRKLYLKTPIQTAKSRIGARVLDHFDRQLKAIFGEERVQNKVRMPGDPYTRRIIGEMSLIFRAFHYNGLTESGDVVPECLRFSYTVVFPRSVTQADRAVFLRLPDITLYFLLHSSGYHLCGAVLTYYLNVNDTYRQLFPWYCCTAEYSARVRKYFWVEKQFVPIIRKDIMLNVFHSSISRILFPTFRLFCTAINALIRGGLYVGALRKEN